VIYQVTYVDDVWRAFELVCLSSIFIANSLTLT